MKKRRFSETTPSGPSRGRISIPAGIAGATATGLLVFGYRIYQNFHRSEIEIYTTDFYYPAWIPDRVVNIAMDLWFRVLPMRHSTSFSRLS